MPVPYLQKLAKEGHGTLPELEKKWAKAKRRAAEQGHKDDYAYITGILKKMLSIQSSLVRSSHIVQSGIPATQVMLSPEYVLQAMASWYAPSISNHPNLKFSSSKTCHVRVAEGIKHRRNLSDRIWLFGERLSTTHFEVWHSVLTDQHNHILVDAFGSGGTFMGTRGYHVPGVNDNDPGLTYSFITMVSVAEWFEDYFNTDVSFPSPSGA